MLPERHGISAQSTESGIWSTRTGHWYEDVRSQELLHSFVLGPAAERTLELGIRGSKHGMQHDGM
jgi:hypothetical protein